jgi:diaminopimelate epimerase
MRVRFTKMQGAGNDFVVLDETHHLLHLSAAQYRWLADRHFGVGADQILSIRAAPNAAVDFEYIIHNADGIEVEQCGNGARCFARYILDKGYSHRSTLKVQTRAGVITSTVMPQGQIQVDMGLPVFEPAAIPFDAQGLKPGLNAPGLLWHLDDLKSAPSGGLDCAVLSMGNPHAVLQVTQLDQAPVDILGPELEHYWRFPQRVNVGFMQLLDRDCLHLRVWERGAGETLACGTGACAAVVAGIRQGLLDASVRVLTRGGELLIHWSGAATDAVLMTGPAVTVFAGEINIPEL